MPRAFTTLAFSPSVRATQARYGSRERMEHVAARQPDRAALSEEMQDRLRCANSVLIGTASHDGWPHVQHRGGPRDSIKVLAPNELAFADYSGNRQYISVGNLAENDRMLLLLIDYAERTRLKIWGRGEAIDDDPALLERVHDPDYPARVERVIRMRVEAWDANYNSHIPQLAREIIRCRLHCLRQVARRPRLLPRLGAQRRRNPHPIMHCDGDCCVATVLTTKQGSLLMSLSPSWPGLSRPSVVAVCRWRWPAQRRP